MLWIGGRRRGVGRMWSLSRSERCVFLRERELRYGLVVVMVMVVMVKRMTNVLIRMTN